MRKLFYLFILLLISCKKDINYIQRISENDIEKQKPVEDDWLITHKEKFVSFQDFEKKYKPLNNKDTILLHLININSNEEKLFNQCKNYLSVFFQRKVILSEKQNLLPNNDNSRINNNILQFNAQFILHKVLSKPVFKNYSATMALTTQDIYPDNNWNYVFGLANYSKRVGITSTYRFESEIANKKLQRLIKTASHEISHMFGLTHCITNECLMNGSNHLTELDRNQLRLCSLCQRKLFYRLGINPEVRLNQILLFLQNNDLTEEYKYLKKDSL